MGVRAPEEAPAAFAPLPSGPGPALVVSFGALAFALLVSNGRPIPEGSDVGVAYAGKALASLAAAGAMAVLFAAMGRAHASATARSAALVFGLGTTVWATSQHLGPQPFGVLAVSLALLFLLKAGDDRVWAGRLGLPLGLAVAVWPANVGAAAVLAVGAAVRWPRSIPWLVAWAAPGILLRFAVQPFLGSGIDTGLEGFGEGAGLGHLGLLASPAKGLLFFTPVVVVGVVGMVRAWHWGERWLVGILAGACLAEWAVVGASRDWHGSPGWGPVALTSVLPLVLLFLPEGFEKLPRLGASLAVLSIAAQVLGAFAADGRWERLYQGGGGGGKSLWDVGRSPLLFYARRRTLILALPQLRGTRWRVREHRLVVGGATGSRFGFQDDDVVVRGADSNASDVHLLNGARVEGDHAVLETPGDGLFLRVRSGARLRTLELRLSGRGSGSLDVGEGSFWSPPRVKEYPVAGAFHLRHRYLFAESGGGDITVALHRGRSTLSSVSLVAPGDPDNPIEVPR
jgi:hypothetical protein